MRIPPPNGPIILSDLISTNIQSNIISTVGSLPPSATLTNFETLNIGTITVQDIIMENGTVTGVSRINDIIIESHVSRHILGGQDVIPISFAIPSNIGELSNAGVSNDIPKADHVHAHGNQIGGTLHANVTSTTNGFMSSNDKIILDQIVPYDGAPLPLGAASIGTMNSYSRPDHVHAHGPQAGGSLHTLVTDTTNGFMSAANKTKMNNFAWNQTTTTLSTNYNMNIPSQPYGYIFSSGITEEIVDQIHTPLYYYFAEQEDLTDFGLNNGSFVVSYPGIYMINVTITVLQTVPGSVYGYILINNVKYVGADFYTFTPSVLGSGTINMNAIVKLEAQDVLYATIVQNTGAPMNISSNDVTNKFVVKMLYGTGAKGSSLPRWSQQLVPNNSVPTSTSCPVALSSDGNILVSGYLGYMDSPPRRSGSIRVYYRTAGTWALYQTNIVGTGSAVSSEQGYSVAISSDGTTIATGGNLDNATVGAAWVFVLVSGVWTQQGVKLVGTPSNAGSFMGSSVSLSADGNTLSTACIGADFLSVSAYIFTRSAGVWSQQGPKLTGAGYSGIVEYVRNAISTSVSGDGNTMVLGGGYNDNYSGAVWIFTRTAGVWTQIKMLTSVMGASPSDFGSSTCISTDGNTLAVGGVRNDFFNGAVWIFVWNGADWVYQERIICTGTIGTSRVGKTVSLSSDGNTLAIGGYYDNYDVGATWILTRTGTVWTQRYKMTGNDEGASPVIPYRQGHVSISGDATTVAVGNIFFNVDLNGRFFVFVSNI